MTNKFKQKTNILFILLLILSSGLFIFACSGDQETGVSPSQVVQNLGKDLQDNQLLKACTNLSDQGKEQLIQQTKIEIKQLAQETQIKLIKKMPSLNVNPSCLVALRWQEQIKKNNLASRSVINLTNADLEELEQETDSDQATVTVPSRALSIITNDSNSDSSFGITLELEIKLSKENDIWLIDYVETKVVQV